MKKLLLVIFFIALIFTNPVSAKKLKFVHISDTHLSLTGQDYRGRNVTKAAQNLKQAIKDINKMRGIDFVIFTGDMIDTADKDDLIAFLKVANKLHKPYYVVIGNHEVFRYQYFGKKEFMHTVWLHHPQMIFKKPNYVFKPNRDIVFIVVDGANELVPGPSGYFKPETLAWLDKQLKKYKHKKVVIAQHFPIVPPSKKTSHNTVDVEKYFQVINSYDNIIAIVSGHFHYNNMIYKKGIYHISAPAFVMKPNSYKVITIDYKPRYLFSDPPEFSVKQELVSVDNEEVEEVQEVNDVQGAEDNLTPDQAIQSNEQEEKK